MRSIFFHSAGKYDLDVVGESRYQTELQEINEAYGGEATGGSVPLLAELIHEKENSADPNATLVCIDGRPVGYLSRDDAAAYQQTIEKLAGGEVAAVCPAQVRGGFVLLVLWLLLGYVGAHRWYAGRGSWLFTLTFGYVLIGWLFDLVLILAGRFRDGSGRPIWF